MKIDLTGRTAVITGGSRGLGQAMATALAESGAAIALVARDTPRLESARDLILRNGGTAEAFAADVTREDEVAAAARAIRNRFGSPQILINNAGINIRKNLVDFTLQEFRSVLDTSLISTFLMCRAFVPGMKSTGYGRVLNMASTMDVARPVPRLKVWPSAASVDSASAQPRTRSRTSVKSRVWRPSSNTTG